MIKQLLFQFWYTSSSTTLLTKALVGISSTVQTESCGRTSSSISALTSSVCSLSSHSRVSSLRFVMPDLITSTDFGKFVWSGGMTSSSSSSSIMDTSLSVPFSKNSSNHYLHQLIIEAFTLVDLVAFFTVMLAKIHATFFTPFFHH